MPRSSGCETCAFRRIDEGFVPEALKDVMGVLATKDIDSVVDTVREEDEGFDENRTTSEQQFAEILPLMETPVCSVDECTLSTGHLFRYITSAGSDIPRQAIDDAVAPSCQILDVPHAIDHLLDSMSHFWPDETEQ